MQERGSNLPDFRRIQLDFAAHIRNPETADLLSGIDARRMKIYIDLFYNNIESFLANTFPIAKQVLKGEVWNNLVREYIHTHTAETPYFLEIPEEFLKFLQQREQRGSVAKLPDFMLELCHYEWVELAVDVSEAEIPEEDIDPGGDLLAGSPVLSPLAWSLSYTYPVHQIGPGFLPGSEPGEYFFVVYRNRMDKVGFIESNVVTARLLQLLTDDTAASGKDILQKVADELPHLRTEQISQGGIQTLEKFRSLDIILGTKC